jgi:antitoxin ParD1/3/4
MRKGGSETKGAAMKVTVDVPPNLEAQLGEYMDGRDPAEVQRELNAAFARALAVLMLANNSGPLSDPEYDALVAELDAHFDACAEPGTASLPDEAFTRESIYGDHP